MTLRPFRSLDKRFSFRANMRRFLVYDMLGELLSCAFVDYPSRNTLFPSLRTPPHQPASENKAANPLYLRLILLKFQIAGVSPRVQPNTRRPKAAEKKFGRRPPKSYMYSTKPKPHTVEGRNNIHNAKCRQKQQLFYGLPVCRTPRTRSLPTD